MAKYVDYYDKNMESQLKEFMGSTYGSLQPVIIDILLRRKKVFNLSEKQCMEEADRLTTNCDKFEFTKLTNAKGISSLLDRKIMIDSRNTNTANLLEFYQTITHEVTHSLSYSFKSNDPNNKEELKISDHNVKVPPSNTYINIGMEKIDLEKGTVSPLGLFGTGLNESYTEANAASCVKDRNNIFTSNGEVGYAMVSNICPHLISACIGATDNELIYASQKGEDAYKEVIAKYFMQGKSDKIDPQLAKMGLAVDDMNKIIFGNLSRGPETVNGIVRSKFLADSMKAITEASYEMANISIENDKRELSDEYVLELATRYNKIDAVLTNSKNRLALNGYASPVSMAMTNTKEIVAMKNEMMSKIFSIHVLNKYKDEIGDDVYPLTDAAKSGELEQYVDLLKNHYNIDIQKEQKTFYKDLKKMEKTKENTYLKRLESEDLQNGEKWNQAHTLSIMKTLVKEVKQEKSKNDTKISEVNPDLFLKTILNRGYSYNEKAYIDYQMQNQFGLTDVPISDNYTKYFKAFNNYTKMTTSVDFHKNVEMDREVNPELQKSCKSVFERMSNETLKIAKYVVDNSEQNFTDAVQPVESAKENLFITSKGLDNFSKKYNSMTEALARDNLIDSNGYIELNSQSGVRKNINQVHQSIMYKYLAAIEPEKISSVKQQLDEAVKNGNFEEVFEEVRADCGINKNLSAYEKSFEKEKRNYFIKKKVKDSVDKLMAPFKRNNQKLLSSGQEEKSESVVSEASNQVQTNATVDERTAFLNGLRVDVSKLENNKQNIDANKSKEINSQDIDNDR